MQAAAFKSDFWVSEQSHCMKSLFESLRRESRLKRRFHFQRFVLKFEISAADQNLSLRAKILIKILNF